MESLCIDSDVLIDFLRNEPEAVGKMRAAEGNYFFCTTACNAYELLAGAVSQPRRAAVTRLLDRLRVLPLTRASAEKSAETCAALKTRGESLPLADLLIAGIALENNCALLTGNTKHFGKIPGLKLA